MAVKTPPAWRFEQDRQHWTVSEATDQGFPLHGEWRIQCGPRNPRLESGIRCWRADAASAMKLRVAFTGQSTEARVYWKRLDDDKFDRQKSLTLKLNADGQFHAYTLDFAHSAAYRGLITGLAIEPVAQPQPGAEMAIQSIELVPSRK